MPKIIELKVDRNLILSNFDGYKLSLDVVPILRQTLANAIFKSRPKSSQYSIHFMELFSMQNFLIQDPWLRNTSYFIDCTGSLQKLLYNESIGRPMDVECVYKIEGLSGSPEPGNYNLSFHFISERYCIFCDGQNEIQILDTGDRYKTPPIQWKLVYKTKISEEFNNFIIKDGRLDIFEEGKKCISICLQRVHQYEENGSHYNQLFWCIIKEQQHNVWGDFEIKDILFGKGTIQYCGFELKSGSIILAASKEFEFESMKNQNINNEEQITKNFRYSWIQNNEDVIIVLKLLENENKNTININSFENKLTIQSSEREMILDSELFGKIDSSLTTWNWEDEQLSITLVKANPNQFWPYIVKNGPKESIITTDSVDSEIEENQIISNLNEIDYCDFPNDLLDEEYAIDRFNFETKTITHRVILGNSPILFTTILRPGFPSAFSTRYDVDASLWLQDYNPNKPNEFNFRHDGNLHAFGYVQASKQQKKFIGCSPDLSYSIICESFRHIFIYKSKYDTASGLRCRNGPNISIGKQHLLTLDESCGEVLGMSCDNSFVTLLTENFVLYLQINSSS